MSRTRSVFGLLLGAFGVGLAADQKPGGPPPKISEVVLAAYTRAPYVAYFRAPQFVYFNGDLVVVRGTNFGAPAIARTLRLRANNRSVAMTVSVWSDTLIRAHVPGGQAFEVPLSGPRPLRRDFTGEIGIAEKGDSGWAARVPIRVAFVWNFQLAGDRDGDGVTDVAYGGSDCDDRDRRRYPGNAEVADTLGLDEDCDPTTIGERDIDNDGYTDARVFNWVNGRVTKRGQDCNDLRTNVNPRVAEACNNIDENCDGIIDEELLNCPTANRRP